MLLYAPVPSLPSKAANSAMIPRVSILCSGAFNIMFALKSPTLYDSHGKAGILYSNLPLLSYPEVPYTPYLHFMSLYRIAFISYMVLPIVVSTNSLAILLHNVYPIDRLSNPLPLYLSHSPPETA